jgi:hypothetical protein
MSDSSDKYSKRDDEDRRSPRRDERPSHYDNERDESGKEVDQTLDLTNQEK